MDKDTESDGRLSSGDIPSRVNIGLNVDTQPLARGASELAPKTFYIKTFGCQMNFRDSEILAGGLIKRGAKLVDNWEDADIVLFNTCAVRKHAEDRAFSVLGSIAKKSRRKGMNQKFGLIGCAAEEYKEEAFKKAPYLDIVCGPNDLYHIVEGLDDLFGRREKFLFAGAEKRPDEFYQGAWLSGRDKHSYVTIIEGCSNFCSYCIVPYVRGRERSRPYKDILDEIKMLVDKGKSEFTLLGQNVNNYYYKPPASSLRPPVNFVELLRMVEKIEGVEKIDFVTLHPKSTPKELFEFMASSKKVKKHLHLPFQSGSDRILKMMNRGYTKEHYLNLVYNYKKITGGELSTDVIVGFPTETERDFLETKGILEEVKFSTAYIFKYSPRPRTPAADLEDDVPKYEKERRHRELLDLQKEISLLYKKRKG